MERTYILQEGGDIFRLTITEHPDSVTAVIHTTKQAQEKIAFERVEKWYTSIVEWVDRDPRPLIMELIVDGDPVIRTANDGEFVSVQAGSDKHTPFAIEVFKQMTTNE